MAIEEAKIIQMLQTAFPDGKISIQDLSGNGNSYAVEVISESFRGKSMIEQHKMVYRALQGKIGPALHALSLQTKLPELSPPK